MSTWDRLRRLFDTDDGGLYDIRLTGLDERGLVAAFEFVRSRSPVTPDAHFWHTKLELDQRVADYPNAAELVVSGVAEPFHVGASDLRFRGTMLPHLGVYLLPDELAFDYRMGPEWGEPQLFALFELLRQLADLTGGQVSLGRHVLGPVNVLFVREWKAYCASNATST